MLNAEQILAATGLTYRQLDHWTRRGYLRTANSESDKRQVRLWFYQERDVATLMVRLSNAGFTTKKAHRIARAALGAPRNGRASIRIADDVVVTIKGDPL